MTIRGEWVRIASHEALQRSSQCVSVIESKAYVFGGELKPRQPRDNAIHIVSLASDSSDAVTSLSNAEPAPSPRVGSATATLANRIYLFSGRGGEAMAPVDEHGSLWSFDTSSRTWSQISPAANTSFPDPRSYHCATSDASTKIYLHAGCPEKGRLADFWSFDIESRTWTELASAPAPPRGGPSIAYADGKIYRMNGFDGTRERGGSVDVYSVAENNWTSKEFAPDGKTGPGARSVAALVYVQVRGKGYLINLFGESDPSDLGHLGAGKMLSDVWAYSIEEETWTRIESEGQASPQARGWFDADGATIDGNAAVVVTGGLGESNERLDDIWALKLT